MAIELRRDLLLSMGAVIVGAASLTYPYGHDQGLYGYVAREWLEGRLPYVASFDVKTPGIYITYVIAAVLFGKAMWGIRVLDLLAIVALGWTSATLATPPGTKPISGLRGATAFATSLLYYGFFYFWDTAQCESFCIAFAMGGMCVVARLVEDAERSVVRRRVFLAGLLGGVALLLKPPALWFLAITFVLMLVRVRRSRLEAVALHVLGGVLPIALTIAYFALHHAMRDFYEIVVVNNRYYVIQGRWVNSVSDVVDRLGYQARDVWPVGCALVVAVIAVFVIARRRRDVATMRIALAALASFVAVVVAVTMQLKFCGYHWVLLVAPFSLAFALAAREAAQRISEWRALTVAMVVLVALFSLGRPARRYLAEQRNFLAFAFGRMDRERYVRTFDVDGLLFSAWWTEKMGKWAHDHTSADDTIAVRGFEPGVYIAAERRAPTRFFWTTPLVMKGWAYKAEQWTAEDRAALEAARPKLVFALATSHDNIESVEYFLALGYVERERFGNHVALERAP